MLAIPVAFLPFDPNRDSKESDDESCLESDEESSEDILHDAISNGENNHEHKHIRHIGGGVLLVRKIFFVKKIRRFFCFRYFHRVRQVNVFLLQC